LQRSGDLPADLDLQKFQAAQAANAQSDHRPDNQNRVRQWLLTKATNRRMRKVRKTLSTGKKFGVLREEWSAATAADHGRVAGFANPARGLQRAPAKRGDG